MKHFPRQIRVADQIQKELADLLRREFKDPRVGMITFTAVEVAGDYAHAKVYVSSLQGEEVLARSLEALRDGAGFLRHHLGRRLTLHTLPQLHFLADTSADRAFVLTNLINAARAADEAFPKS
ncbi:30S ribosome-binding factor RbfA [Ferrovum myxofaciens]|uniref:Ribosome-binding factor A n=2 Tax=root TaxID=1 RepID=A0A9E6SYT2_9PROT|nr:30S ribosome-binding factor RbfA [Ferrovum myxofaciens]MBU6993786.1 30S ribosome-binding factor RbfA [Ferrovum myxofaciens]QKE37820.1 MAG: 30S ribosome-binding factor RbfA [Ferrovum myxofaciens]QKE40452.1 MAG: 30S ribosome-binding factor RbfA [Ferrovum myxofaciens]QWY75493.1 MAG: 30S ribosome-binding factor RbfA [Ferrovum myxofaciens]QWY78231.1 MAG: 30S ribosome-binding factor RbfA [Ferrovum myxofaciens]